MKARSKITGRSVSEHYALRHPAAVSTFDERIQMGDTPDQLLAWKAMAPAARSFTRTCDAITKIVEILQPLAEVMVEEKTRPKGKVPRRTAQMVDPYAPLPKKPS